MKITEACKKTGITRRNIHFYIKEGLICPAVDKHSHYYDFSGEDCENLILIRELRNAGLSISAIRSILNKPVMAGYYLCLHVKKLEYQKQYLEKNIESMNYILGHLPIYPEADNLRELAKAAKIPVPTDGEVQSALDIYDRTLTNRYLWSAFLPVESFTDYQEFLWNKLHRITADAYVKDYTAISNYLKSLDSLTIEQVFAARLKHYDDIAALTEEGCLAYADTLCSNLSAVMKNPRLIREWKEAYHAFYKPSARIYASQLGDLVEEMSPFFAAYRKNINHVCQILYDWLTGEEGSVYYAKMKQVFGEYLDIENDNHGQLEAIASLH